MEKNNIEDKELIKTKEEPVGEKRPKPMTFWRWYFPSRPIIFIRFLLFSYYVQWFIWNIIIFFKKENLEAAFLLQRNWQSFGGITLIFGPIMGTIFILVTVLPLLLMWVFYAMRVSKWQEKDSAMRFWAGLGLLLTPFVSTLFFMLLSLILGVYYR
jgi:hypothetical protein